MARDSQYSAIGTVAVVGFGHFGRALADLLRDGGILVRAWDTAAPVPDEIRSPDLAALASGADFIVIATPIDQIRPALVDLRPHLSPDNLVIDVGSVKQQPIDTMLEILGDEIPWVATHPLFGPTNITRGERSLRAVVCPNDVHPGAAGRARELYEQLGCEVIEQPGREHDRLMARTHAMAFFIAKGLIDIGAGDDLPFSPPSFQALARTIESVRGDAGHLFLAIERANPYAADARQALLDALARVHGQLDLLETVDAGADPAETLTIPDLGEQAPELMETRDLIDDLDREIVRLLARRTRLAGRAGRIKTEHGKGIRDPGRERAMLQQRREWAAEHGLAEEALADVFSAVLRFSREAQEG